MIKRIIAFVCILSMSSLFLSGKDKTKVWHNPSAVLATASSDKYVLHINKVEFRPDETVVSMRIRNNSPQNIIKILPTLSLFADGQPYKLLSAEGLEIGKKSNMPLTGVNDYTFHFEPLPLSVETFDFIEGNSKNDFRLTDVRERGISLESSNWRDPETGDWLIGFFPDFAIYDAHVWRYADKDFNRGRFLLKDGLTTVRVEAGKEKSGKRKLKIDGKEYLTERITGLALGDYPSKGEITRLADNGYSSVDTVTISGCLLNMPLPDGVTGGNAGDISVNYVDMFTSDTRVFTTPVDSAGFFTLRFPIPNTLGVKLDENRIDMLIPVEPGENYFLFYDCATRQLLWMGEKSRLLNELSAHSFTLYPSIKNKPSGEDIATALSDHYMHISAIADSVAAAVPSLSPMWAEWIKTINLAECLHPAGQSRFKVNPRLIPAEVRQFISETILPGLPTVPTAVNTYRLSGFLRDFSEDLVATSPLKFSIQTSPNSYITTYIEPEVYGELRPRLDSVRTQVEHVLKLSSDTLPECMKDSVVHVFRAINKFMKDKGCKRSREGAEIRILAAAVDSMTVSPVLKDMIIALALSRKIRSECRNLSAEMEPYIDRYITLAQAREAVHALNDSYKNLVIADVKPGSGIKVPADELCAAVTGKELFDKALAPFRGHLVMIDVWGTWCGSCRVELSKFREHRKKFDPYGMIYMFFASRSSEKDSRRILEEYGVDGENVVHYNLPEEKQRLLENYLGVKGYPHYRIVNTDGTLLNVDIRPSLSKAVTNLLDRITSSQPE